MLQRNVPMKSAINQWTVSLLTPISTTEKQHYPDTKHSHHRQDCMHTGMNNLT